MKIITEIKKYKTFMELYNDFIKINNCVHTDSLKSVIYSEIKDKGMIEENGLVFIHDTLNLLD